MQINSESILLEIKDLNITYGKTPAVKNFNLSMNHETVVLFGSSGCGKTTILKSILGIHESGKKVTGTVCFNNVELNPEVGDIGMTFQGPVIPSWLKVGDLCAMGRNIRKLGEDERIIRIMEMLKIFNIEQHYNKYPSELSGGEKQRVALAVTLLNQPKILLLDEPTTFIDGATRLTIWKHIENNIRPLNIPTLIVSHDSMESIILADRILILGETAQIKRDIIVPFKHPRSEELFKTDSFWDLKAEVEKSYPMKIESMPRKKKETFNILVLDGGGSMGTYTIGVLKELEIKLRRDLDVGLHEHFDLIYGTSTGAIIATLIALGRDMSTIENLYLTLIPEIMGGCFSRTKSKRLKLKADELFKNENCASFKTLVGLVSVNYNKRTPMIFKSSKEMAHRGKDTFVPFFGNTISEAVQASCAAYPIFNKKAITTSNKQTFTLIDGGFIANNATFFSLIDAHISLKQDIKGIRLLNIGVGIYNEKPLNFQLRLLRRFGKFNFITQVIQLSTYTHEELSKLFFPQLKRLTINSDCKGKVFNNKPLKTNMIEKNEKVLKQLVQFGMEAFQEVDQRNEINNLFY